MLVATLDIPGHPRQVKAARTFTALVLEAHGQPDDGTAGLLVSELVTNSLLHSASGKPGGIITVAVAITPYETIVEITDDGGPTEPSVREDGGTHDEQTSAEDGRGLRLVRELSAEWGFYCQGGRLTTWFDLGAKGHDDMRDRECGCGCGYQADNAEDLTDHLGEFYTTDDDVAPDGQAHAEAGGGTPGRHCLCGFTADADASLDDHLLHAFTPDDQVGRDGTRHCVAAVLGGATGGRIVR
jgi:serine/threonine-protein kinase RsbW